MEALAPVCSTVQWEGRTLGRSPGRAQGAVWVRVGVPSPFVPLTLLFLLSPLLSPAPSLALPRIFSSLRYEGFFTE